MNFMISRVARILSPVTLMGPSEVQTSLNSVDISKDQSVWPLSLVYYRPSVLYWSYRSTVWEHTVTDYDWLDGLSDFPMALFCLLCFDLTVYNQINSEILSYKTFLVFVFGQNNSCKRIFLNPLQKSQNTEKKPLNNAKITNWQSQLI